MSNERPAICDSCQNDVHCYERGPDCAYWCACLCPPQPCHYSGVGDDGMDGRCGARLLDTQRKGVSFSTTNMWTHVTCRACLLGPTEVSSYSRVSRGA